MQKLDDSRCHVQPQLADLRTCYQQKRKGKRPCEQEFWIFRVKAKPRRHTARCLKDEIADEQRPADAQHDLTDGVDDGNVLAQVREIQTHQVKQHGRKILPAFQDQAIDPFDKALKEQFQQAARTSFSTG